MTKPTALIIEDSHELASLIATVLRQENVMTVVVEDGAEALAYLSEHTPDLIILDLQLPNVSGIEILEYINGEPRLEKTKTVIASASPGATSTIKDADLVLLKPITLPQLQHVISKFLGQSKDT